MLNTQNKIRGFPIAILTTPGGHELAQVVDQHLKALFRDNGEPCPSTFIRESRNFRFQNGEGKAKIIDSIRGTDLFIIVDVGNQEVFYTRYGQEVPMSPDEHFADLKRLLGAAKNMAQRTTVIMPLLYESRQHKIAGRESLDCALALQEMVNMGVGTIMTIDAHNSHVVNAIPMHGIENLHATYQLIEAFLEKTLGKLNINKRELVVCSPDLGGMERARYFAEHFHVHLTGFYKYRDLTRVVNGKNPIAGHTFLGAKVRGKSVLVIDDLLASGGSMLEVCHELSKRGANDVYLSVTYALFSEGLGAFDEAYEQGLFRYVFGTNSTYISEELLKREWFIPVDVTKFIAKFIHTFNQDGSVTRLLDSTSKISRLLGRELPNRQTQQQASAGAAGASAADAKPVKSAKKATSPKKPATRRRRSGKNPEEAA
jgi:ribose-phosphate pyrophosphokinase